ncbi:RDD family protein [Chitinimonas sp. BJYL2]|uniref:RDD family protein n=1 Tax=Chitinimonas sp. BJYL2 TaxID=2976696 RepID=UPI0022B44F95|nr:RDD family protein [Chitinimonas sp. BJYL2]
MSQNHPLASRRRRLVALVYESLLLLAISLAAGMLSQMLLSRFAGTPVEFMFLLACWFGYFAWCWRRSGQTLAMKTWRLQLRAADNQLASWRAMGVRFALGVLVYLPIAPAWIYARYNPDMKWVLWASLIWAALPWLWSLVDRDKQLLHDRLAGLHIVLLPINRAD